MPSSITSEREISVFFLLALAFACWHLTLRHFSLHRANYISAAMIFLRSNALLDEPLKHEHIKKRLLGVSRFSPSHHFLLFSFFNL